MEKYICENCAYHDGDGGCCFAWFPGREGCVEDFRPVKKWWFTASTDGNQIDFETVIKSEKKPSFWHCNELAEENGCTLWSIEELKE